MCVRLWGGGGGAGFVHRVYLLQTKRNAESRYVCVFGGGGVRIHFLIIVKRSPLSVLTGRRTMVSRV